jgi:hypothetical protein
MFDDWPVIRQIESKRIRWAGHVQGFGGKAGRKEATRKSEA